MRVKLYALRGSGILSRVCSLILKPCSLARIPWDSRYLPVMSISCFTTFSVNLIRKSKTCLLKLPFKSTPWVGLSVAAPTSMPKLLWSNLKSILSSVILKQSEDVTTLTFMTQWSFITLTSKTGKRLETCVLISQSTLKKKMVHVHRNRTNSWEVGWMLIQLSKELCFFSSTFLPKKVTTKTSMEDWVPTVFLLWLLHTSKSSNKTSLKIKDKFSWTFWSFTVKILKTNWNQSHWEKTEAVSCLWSKVWVLLTFQKWYC